MSLHVRLMKATLTLLTIQDFHIVDNLSFTTHSCKGIQLALAIICCTSGQPWPLVFSFSRTSLTLLEMTTTNGVLQDKAVLGSKVAAGVTESCMTCGMTLLVHKV